MITLLILASMTILIARSVQQTIQFKKTLQLQLDDTTQVQNVVRVLERDLQMAFHYRDYHKTIEELVKRKQAAAQKGSATTSTSTTTSGTPSSTTSEPTTTEVPEVKAVDPETHFVGDEKSMSFVTMNNSSFFSSETHADFVTVGYEVKTCRSLNVESESSECLWRRLSKHVGPDPTKGGEEVAILDHITEFKLRYRGKEKDDWISSWKSNSKSDSGATSRYPDAVEISLSLERKDQEKNRKYSYQYIIPIHFPNNPTKEDKK